MKKKYLKPYLEIVDIASSTIITLDTPSQNGSDVLNFTDNPGETMGWNEFFN